METSVKGGSISIFLNGNLIDFYIGDKSVSGSEDLLPKISELLCENNLKKSNVETIAVSNGPGSFTGIRIGIATSLALQKAIKCNCYGVDLLQAMALDGKLKANTENIITAVSQGRSKVCWYDFHNTKREKSYFVSNIQNLSEHIMQKIRNNEQFSVYVDSETCQTLIENNTDDLLAKFDLRSAGQNLSLIIGKAVLGGMLKLGKPQPLYLNESSF